MKSGYVAILLLLMLGIGIGVNAFFLDKTIQSIVKEVEALPLLADPSPKAAVPVSEAICQSWKQKETYLMLFIHRNKIAAISVLFQQMTAAAKLDMEGDFQVAVAEVLAALEQLEHVSSFQLHYVF